MHRRRIYGGPDSHEARYDTTDPDWLRHLAADLDRRRTMSMDRIDGAVQLYGWTPSRLRAIADQLETPARGQRAWWPPRIGLLWRDQ